MNFKVLSIDDCDIIRQMRNEKLWTLRTPYLLTKEMQEEFYFKTVCNRDAKSRFWGIWNYEDKLIGCAGINNIEWENGLGEISLLINAMYTLNGNGSKAFNLLLDKAFNELRLESIHGECYECNDGVEFWKKQVKIFDGYSTILKNRKFHDGRFFDALYFSINKEDYNKCLK